MAVFTRQYYFEITDDRQSLVMGTHWNPETNKLNQIGIMTKTIANPYVFNFNFKLPNGQEVNLEGATLDEVIDSIKDYFSKDDFIGLCPVLFLWSSNTAIREMM